EQLADQESDAKGHDQARDRPLLDLAPEQLLGRREARTRPLADLLGPSEHVVALGSAEVRDAARDGGHVAAQRVEILFQLVDIRGEIRGCRCHSHLGSFRRAADSMLSAPCRATTPHAMMASSTIINAKPVNSAN